MDFFPVTPDDYKRLGPFFKNQRYELCTYSLPSIIAWQTCSYAPYAAILDGALIIAAEYQKTPEDRHLILPVSPEREFSPGELASLARDAGHSRYWFAPEDYISRHGADEVGRHFEVIPRPGFSDYVYNQKDLALLAGDRYHKKRNLIRQFEKAHSMGDEVGVTDMTPADADDCLDFLDEWCAERDCNRIMDSDISCERNAAENAIRNLDSTGWRGLILRINGTVSAFGLASRLTGDMGTLNFEKAFSSVKGLYQYFDRECANRLFSGLSFINKESDMGEPGLAKAKHSYHPARIVSAFDLVLK